MEFRLLGPFEACVDGRGVDLPRLKHRALLACLALRAGEVVSLDRLGDDLWGDGTPASVRTSLQTLVSQLRRTFGTAAILTQPGGYLLDVDPDAVDSLRFERLVAAAGAAAGEERAALLRRALGLWRGAPLADLAFEPFARREIDRLEEAGAGAQEELVEAELGLGRDAELVPRIEALVARNPLRERPRGQLLVALYRSGRQAEALTAYQELRRALVEGLGVEPSPALRELEQAILRQDPALLPASPAPPAAPEIRRLATVLVAAAHGGGERALPELRAAAEYHGGTVGHAAGGELLAVFAGHEDDPLRAGRAALQMRRALDPLGIELRAALATEQLAVADGSGPAVALARRLAGSAAAGEILLDAATASAGGLTTEPRGAGVALLGAETVPVLGAGGAALAGRAAELDRLRAAFAEARAERRCRLAVVAGEAGIGKSRLAAELVRAVAADATVLVGRCASYGEGATYLPLREAIVQAVGEATREAIEERLAGDEHAAAVAAEIAGLVSPGGGTSSTGQAFWAARRFLESLAGERPLVLVLDDVHWAEPTLLDLVEYLEQWSRSAPILVLCLTRPELLVQRHGWNEHTIRLQPLADEDAESLVAQLAAGVPAASRARIVELAEGNPLYAEQLAVRALEGTSALDSVPPSLEALISSRIDRLGPGERAVLERAAVVGREFWHGAVLHLSDPLEVPAVGRHLLELARQGLIRPGRPVFPREDGFKFHHVLIRDVAYASVPAALRAELHERVAGWLGAQAPDRDELIGYHLEHANRCAPAERLAAAAGDRLATAGLRAWKRADVPAAANLLGRAAALLPPAEALRRDVLAELALVRWKAGEPERAAEQLRASLAAAERARDGRAGLRSAIELAYLGLYHGPASGADGLLALVESSIPALERLGDDRALGRAWFATATVHGAIHCQYGRSEQAALQALAGFRRSGWPARECQQALAAAFFYGPATVEAGIAGCRALLDELELSGEADVLVLLGGLEAMRGRFADARAHIARSVALYEDLGWADRVSTFSAPMSGLIELLAGDPAAAETAFAESCEALTRRHDWTHLATQAAQLGEAVYRQGRYAEAAAWADISAQRAADDDASAQFSSRALRAKLLARSGTLEQAEALAREAVELAAATDSLSQRGDVLLDLAEVLRLAGRPGEAAGAAGEALALYERKGNSAAAGRASGLLAGFAPA